MRFALLIKTLVIGVLIVSHSVQAATPQLPEQVIFRRTIDDTRELVVVRGASVTGEQLKASWPKDSQLPTLGYSVRVEMHTKPGGPLLLGSQMHYENPNSASEFLVLDALADAQTTVLAIGASGTIKLWKLELTGEKHDLAAYLRGSEWATSDVRPIEKDELNVRLTWNEQKRVEVRMDSTQGRLTFQEDAKEWKFTRVAVIPVENGVPNALFPKFLFSLRAPFGNVYVVAREPQRMVPLEGFLDDVDTYALLPVDIVFSTRQQPRIVVAARFVAIRPDSPANPLEMLAGFIRKGRLAFASLEEGWISVWDVGMYGEISVIGHIDLEWVNANHLGVTTAKDLKVTLTIDEQGRFFVTIIDHRLGDDKAMRYLSTNDWKFKREDGPATQPGK